jgi:hypothetical protein
MTRASSLLALPWVLVLGCGGGGATSDAGSAGNDAGTSDAAPVPDGGAAHDAAGITDGGGHDAYVLPRTDAGSSTFAGGDASGTWCGDVTVTAAARVPAGATLSICAGATVHFAATAGVTIDGTLVAAGESGVRVLLTSDTSWPGLTITPTGALTATFTDIERSSYAINGQAGGTIAVEDSTIAADASSITINTATGGRFDRTQITGGTTVVITGGTLRMTDSTIDLGHPTASPDCTSWSGGGAVLDHVHFTGCHCPIHINSASLPVSITHSVLDGAGDPVMIGHATATITDNDLVGVSTLVLDIGDGDTVSCDVSNNWWDRSGAHAVDVGTRNVAQFTGTSTVASAPIPGAGPR